LQADTKPVAKDKRESEVQVAQIAFVNPEHERLAIEHALLVCWTVLRVYLALHCSCCLCIKFHLPAPVAVHLQLVNPE
jgi:hypothetical protein